ncbi:MAG TPA: acetolactate synthase large subunit [Terriglobia bacterium]|nr:acetolactate synthase large subunit [Terriglobia bacterium]
MTGAECLLRTLLSNGVDLCLANPGTSEMQFVAALDRVEGMRGVLCLFEGVCSGAADGYARMARKPAATLLHLGPGLGNAIANLHNAKKARVPLVNIVGQHATAHLKYDAPLTADIEALASVVSSYVRVVASAEEVGAATADVVSAALKPPGQVATLIAPADFSWSEGGEPAPAVPRPRNPVPSVEAVREAARILCSGELAGLLLSGGALLAPGMEAAGRVSRVTGAQVFMHRYAARYDRGAGRFEATRIPYFPEPAEEALAGLKHLILVETPPPVSFFAYPGRRSCLAPEDCLFHTLASTGQDGTAALDALVQELGAGNAQAPVITQQRPSIARGGALTVEMIGRTLSALLPEGAMISDEMVSSGGPVWEALRASAPHSYMPNSGGAIGQGLPLAVGAALACPEGKAVALQADGSGMYTPQSLWTMGREKLNVVTVIFANRRYRILDIEMRRTGADGFGPRAESLIDIGHPDLNWVKLAEGMGVEAGRAHTADEFARLLGVAMEQRGPWLIEAMLG